MARPRSKKPAHELTNDEVMRQLFPKPVVEKAKKEAEESKRKSSRK
jgi:predicted kinase